MKKLKQIENDFLQSIQKKDNHEEVFMLAQKIYKHSKIGKEFDFLPTENEDAKIYFATYCLNMYLRENPFNYSTIYDFVYKITKVYVDKEMDSFRDVLKSDRYLKEELQKYYLKEEKEIEMWKEKLSPKNFIDYVCKETIIPKEYQYEIFLNLYLSIIKRKIVFINQLRGNSEKAMISSKIIYTITVLLYQKTIKLIEEYKKKGAVFVE